MASTTLYLRPPTKAKQAKRPKGPVEEISTGLYRYRVELTPLGFAFVLLWLTWIVARFGTWITPAAMVACAGLVYWQGARIKLKSLAIRIYAAIVFVVSGVWSWLAVAWATDAKPTLKWMLILALITYPCAAPWLRYRAIRGSVKVTFDPLLSAKARRSMEKRARGAVEGWEGYIRASAASGSTLRAIHFDPWSVTLAVKLGHARVAEDFTELRLRRLESAFEARRDSARVLPERDESSRLAKIRFMLADPLSEMLSPDDLEDTADDELTVNIGRFEDGSWVIMDLIHTLIAGASGMGKSGVINALMRGLARKTNVAVVGIDLKPGGLELGRWEEIMAACATTPDNARALLAKLLRGLEYRGAIMKARGIRKWIPTPAEPFIVCVIDEVQECKAYKLFPLIERLSCLGRAYGFALVLATQHPKDTQVPSTAIANCLQRIGLKCEASTGERLVFGDDATKNGWRLVNLRGDREGCFRIRSKRYREPNLARAAFMDDWHVDRVVEEFRPLRTAIDPGTEAGAIPAGADLVPIEGPDDGTEDDGTVDAVIIEDDPRELVLMAVATGHATPDAITRATSLSRATVVRYLRELRDAGRLMQDKKRGPYRLPRS